jgi:hypothetical protein
MTLPKIPHGTTDEERSAVEAGYATMLAKATEAGDPPALAEALAEWHACRHLTLAAKARLAAADEAYASASPYDAAATDSEGRHRPEEYRCSLLRTARLAVDQLILRKGEEAAAYRTLVNDFGVKGLTRQATPSA